MRSTDVSAIAEATCISAGWEDTSLIRDSFMQLNAMTVDPIYVEFT